ncbi:SigB/SigF/SigG family RNA polymerase sigma factor [Paractinoplanes ferrugineus]|uniref:RNA polymerase sigma factor n=1 Tax=Paractinoplanes ferrugineus TaxID=113564 RepID=A0A919IZ11_9ACTN|nr:SigB/SigF/SigG family RNA polymerase sigma factor [Actinoplanes ferrugineus]GIE10402.1 RNA polymerase sigma factor [Actinoplanes ferrugineus]
MQETAISDQLAAELIEAYATADPADPARPALRDRAIEAWLPLAKHLARRYAGRGEAEDDLSQVAMIGLIKAVDRYDAERGVDFPAFAIPTVLGEVKRYFRDHSWSIRVPRRLQELHLAISSANAQLTQRLGRAPTVADVAAHLEVTEEEVLEGLEGARAYAATSLSTPVADGSDRELGDTIGGPDAAFELTEQLIALRPAIAGLAERERSILAMRFYDDLSQSEIGERLGISQMQVSRLLSRTVATLRAQLLGEDAGAPAEPRHRTRVTC